jgi:hypothetical protein
MADFVFNVAKGKVARYAELPETSDALIVVVIDTAASDATLKDLDTLAAVLADSDTAEVTNSGYARKSLTSATVTVNDASDTVSADIADQTWSAVASGDSWTDLLICYDANTGSGDDSAIIPLTCHDFVVTPDGSDITAQIHASGFFQAS